MQKSGNDWCVNNMNLGISQRSLVCYSARYHNRHNFYSTEIKKSKTVLHYQNATTHMQVYWKKYYSCHLLVHIIILGELYTRSKHLGRKAKKARRKPSGTQPMQMHESSIVCRILTNVNLRNIILQIKPCHKH